MNLVYCEKCGGYTAEGFILCPSCMKEGGAGEAEVTAAAEILDIANILNMGDTDTSQRAAIKSILRMITRLEEADHEEKE